MKLITEPYLDQVARWPKEGKHILAQFDDTSLVVYQAYRPAIGQFASTHGYFGGEFNFQRMSWIKPNFLWMMFRSGWATREGQETILAIWLRRSAFDTILAKAVPSTFQAELYTSELAWKEALARSEVRLQWDPDHDPSGAKMQRRALQLGLRGEMLARYAHDWIIGIEDITAFVHQQRHFALSQRYDQLVLPKESVYAVADESIRQRLGLVLAPSDRASAMQ